MTWTDATLVIVAMIALCAIALLIGYSLLTFVILLVRLVYPETHEPTFQEQVKPALPRKR